MENSIFKQVIFEAKIQVLHKKTIFLDLSVFRHSFPRLFLITIESYYWAISTVGSYISQLLPLAWIKHFYAEVVLGREHTQIQLMFIS